MMEQLKSVKIAEGFLLVIDEFGKMIYVSESVLQHIGFRSLDLNGQSWFSLLHPDDQVYSRAHLRRAVTRCHETSLSSHSVPASPTSPVHSPQTTPTTDSFRTTLTVRLLHGNRPGGKYQPTPSSSPSSQLLDPGSQVQANHDTPPLSDNTDATKDDVFTYRSFNFSGTARTITVGNNVNGRAGWPGNVVWVALGRATPAGEASPDVGIGSPTATILPRLHHAPSSSPVPSHFVMRHDLSGCITHVDHRCKHFTGYEPHDLIGQVIFDHLPPEDSRYLSHQYDLLKAGCESIAVVYRFRSAGKSDNSDTYLNCRAYLTLNPVTFHADLITSLAAALSHEEGEVEVRKQATRLAQSDATQTRAKSMQKDSSEGQTKLQMTCSAQFNSGSDKENCRADLLQQSSTKSPLQSPDSNTHPIDISPLSSTSDSKGGPLVDQVAIIDSQYSPSKHTHEEDSAPFPPSLVVRTLSPAVIGSKPVSEKTHSRKSVGQANQNSGKNSKQNSNTSRTNLALKVEEREPIRKSSHELSQLQSNHFYLPAETHLVPDEKSGRIPNTMFHDQLREKHSYLEESIRNQQQQLQMLQQKLMTLANHGAGIYPMQMQLQGPLNKVMELQTRVGRHREEAVQQRSLVDGGRPPPAYHQHPQHLPPGSLPRRNSTPQIPIASRPRANQPSFARRSSVMAETVNYELRSPALMNQSVQQSLPDYESGRRSAGVISPPFVDMVEQQTTAPVVHNHRHSSAAAASVDPLDALYSSLDLDGESANLGPDFEEKLRELEMLFAPNYTGSTQNQLAPPQSPRTAESGSPYGGASAPSALTVNGNGTP